MNAVAFAEREPEPMQLFLVWLPKDNRWTGIYPYTGEMREWRKAMGATHWCPLPPSPEVKP